MLRLEYARKTTAWWTTNLNRRWQPEDRDGGHGWHPSSKICVNTANRDNQMYLDNFVAQVRSYARERTNYICRVVDVDPLGDVVEVIAPFTYGHDRNFVEGMVIPLPTPPEPEFVPGEEEEEFLLHVEKPKHVYKPPLAV